MNKDNFDQKAPLGEVSPPAKVDFSKWMSLAFLGLALVVAVGVRVRLLDFPLERDEGCFAYMGQILIEGVPPYKLAYDFKPPGLYLAYAAAMAVFGQTAEGIHLGLLMVHLASLLLLFLIARKMMDLHGAAIATAAFALMTLSPAYLGLAAHATHFAMLPVLFGIWMLSRVEKNGRWFDCFAGGCLFGIACLMKQPAVLFGLFGGLYLAWTSLAGKAAWQRALKQLGVYSIGCLLPFCAVCLWLKIAGVFPQFWFWTFSYPHAYGDLMTGQQGLRQAESALAMIFHAAPLLWMIAGLGVACLFLTQLAGKTRIWLGGFLLASVLAVCPGLYFRPHYFILLVPATALLVGLAVSWSAQWFTKNNFGPRSSRLPFLLAALACAQSLHADREVLFFLSPDDASRAVYGVNPFPESAEIARYLEAHTRKDQPIVVLGSEPQIFFYSHRHSATAHIYIYPLMEAQPFARNMQEEMIREIEHNPPACLVLVSLPISWGARADSSHRLMDWAGNYLNQNMRQVGLIQHRDAHTTESVWGPDSATTPLRSDSYIAVFECVDASQVIDREQVIARNHLLMNAFEAETHNSFGNALMKAGQIDEAIGQFQQVLWLTPDYKNAQHNLEKALELKKRSKMTGSEPVSP